VLVRLTSFNGEPCYINPAHVASITRPRGYTDSVSLGLAGEGDHSVWVRGDVDAVAEALGETTRPTALQPERFAGDQGDEEEPPDVDTADTQEYCPGCDSPYHSNCRADLDF
jgi:hypothetical protein